MGKIDKIIINNRVIAIIIPNEYKVPGIEFFTPAEFTQQLAYMKHPKGKKIQPHIHKLMLREVIHTAETLYIKKGKIKVDLYDENKTFITSRILNTGDVILLASGGHGFSMLEESELIEVKQGPYDPNEDKIRF